MDNERLRPPVAENIKLLYLHSSYINCWVNFPLGNNNSRLFVWAGGKNAKLNLKLVLYLQCLFKIGRKSHLQSIRIRLISLKDIIFVKAQNWTTFILPN